MVRCGSPPRTPWSSQCLCNCVAVLWSARALHHRQLHYNLINFGHGLLILVTRLNCLQIRPAQTLSPDSLEPLLEPNTLLVRVRSGKQLSLYFKLEDSLYVELNAHKSTGKVGGTKVKEKTYWLSGILEVQNHRKLLWFPYAFFSRKALPVSISSTSNLYSAEYSHTFKCFSASEEQPGIVREAVWVAAGERSST